MDFNSINIPKNFVWECTRGCNLSCRHCGSDSGSKLDGELTTEEARELIDQVADMGFIFMTLTGGEPLTRTDIHDLISHATGKGISVTICTNGSLIDEEAANKLFESGLRCASVSLDGCGEYHDSNRCGTYEKTLTAIKYLKSKDITVFASMMVSDENLEMLPEVHETASAHGIKRLNIHAPQKCGRAKVNNITLDRDKLIDIILFANSRDSGCTVFLDDGFGIYNNRFGCDAGRSSMFVSADGVVRPCISFPVDSGNVRTDKLLDVWDSPGFRMFRELDYALLDGACKGCEVVESCQGGCRAKVFQRTGDFHAGDEDCAFIKEKSPELFRKASAASALMASSLVLMTPGCVDKPDDGQLGNITKPTDGGMKHAGSIIKVKDLEFTVDRNISNCESFYKANITLETNGPVDLEHVYLYYDGYPLDFELIGSKVTEKEKSLLYEYRVDYVFNSRINNPEISFHYGYLVTDHLHSAIDDSYLRLWAALPLKRGFPANIYLESDEELDYEELSVSVNGMDLKVNRITELTGEENIYLVTTEELSMNLSEDIELDIIYGKHHLEKVLYDVDSEAFYIEEPLPALCPMMIMPRPSVESIQYVGADTLLINPEIEFTPDSNLSVYSKPEKYGNMTEIPIEEVTYRKDYGHVITLKEYLEPGSYVIGLEGEYLYGYYYPAGTEFKTRKKVRILHVLETEKTLISDLYDI